MNNWKLAAQALDLGIPDEELARITPQLDALGEAFRPLVKTIPHQTEPAVKFDCPPEEVP